MPNDSTGQVDTDALADLLDDRVKLIGLTWIPTGGGLVNPAAEVGRIARAADVLYLLDATQAVGQLPIDVGALGCDLLTGTGRKFLRGPRGTGFLWAGPRALDRLEPYVAEIRSAVLGRRPLLQLGRRRPPLRDLGEQLPQHRRPRRRGQPGARPRPGRDQRAGPRARRPPARPAVRDRRA